MKPIKDQGRSRLQAKQLGDLPALFPASCSCLLPPAS